jgi:hypothetical protein
VNSVTRAENIGWGSRIIDSIKGVLIGLVLFVIAFPLLFWNEGRAVRRAQDLAEGRGAVVEASATAVDPSHEGKLVHLTGAAATTEVVGDRALGPAAPGALRMRRVVQMFQWIEERRTNTTSQTGGSQRRTTTITYHQDWSEAALDSSTFDQARDHFNPPMPVRSEAFEPQQVTVGARTLTPALVTQIQNFQAFAVQPAQAPGLTMYQRPITATANGLFVGANPGAPSVGDLRVRWEAAPPGVVTVLAAQRGATFDDWRTPTGRTIEQNLEIGPKSAAEMFGALEAGNTFLTWVLRFVGWLFLFLGVSMVLRPLVVVADVLPFLGSLVGAGAGLAGFVIASPLALITVAAGWIAYRPLLGVGLIAAGFGIAFGLGKLVAARGASANLDRAAQRRA